MKTTFRTFIALMIAVLCCFAFASCEVHEHVGEWTVTKEPTCVAVGEQSRLCEDCGETQIQVLPAKGHTPGEEPTCTTTQNCTECNTVLTAAVGHKPGDPATCTTAQTCTVCETEIIAALGHKPGTAATCTAAQTCTVCNTELAAALGHTAGDAATCTTAQTCTLCKEVLAEALGHTAGAAATCTTAQTCTVCNTELVAAHGHTAGAPATCATAQTCTVCNKELVAAHGHTAGAAATCTTAQTCLVCNVKLADKLGHTAGEAATCTTAQTCTVCDAELVAAHGHTAGAEATCTAAQTCTVCNAELVAALGHTPGAPATCTTAQTCTVCDAELVAAFDHIPGAGATCTESSACQTCGVVLETASGHVPGIAATCTTAQSCVVCNKELVAALGHTAGAEATCTATQNCTVCNTVLVPAHGHTVGQGATCSTSQTCTVCEAVLVSAVGHTAGEAATCTTAQTCTVCNAVMMPALGHTAGAAATCTTTQNCTVCDAVLVPALGHTAGAAATCTTTQNCTVCDAVLVPAFGHKAGAEATCTTAQKCTVCNEKLAEALGHTPGEAATCTTAQKCVVCDAEVVAALGHKAGAAATCTAAQTCTVCNEVLVEKLAHTPGAAATCTTAQKCVVCNEDVAAALGHTEEIIPGVEPTESSSGLSEGKKCSVCGEILVPQQVLDPIVPTGKNKMPGYEDVDFGGATFTIVGCDGMDDGFNSAKEIYSEESDAISVAVRERNELIEALYNCKIEGVASRTPANDALTGVMVGGNTIDLYNHHYSIDSTARDNRVYNLMDLGSREIDFSQPWFDQSYVNSFTVKTNSGKDTLYSIVGDFALTTFDCTHAIVYNKTVFQNDADVNHIDLYQLVRDKKWTMDVFAEIVKNVATDNNNDGVIDSQSGDVAGWIRTSHATHGLHVASGLPIIRNTDGVFAFDVDKNTESWTNVVNKAGEIWAMPEGQLVSYAVIPETVASGNACFGSELIGTTLGKLKDYDAEIGVLPYPLYSEGQENYAHYVDNHVYSYSVPASVAEIEAIGDFLTVYAFHSTYLVRPAYLNTYGYEYCSDEDSAEMLNIIFDTRTYDPGYLCSSSSLEYDISHMIETDKNQIAQYAARKANMANEWIKNFVDGISDNDEPGQGVTPGNPGESTSTETTSSETTTSQTTLPPVFTRFDFGTNSKAQDMGYTSHEFLVNSLTYDNGFVSVEYTEDSIIVKALKDHPEMTFDEDGNEIISEMNSSYYINSYALRFDHIIDWSYDDLLAADNKYMRIRIKNESANNVMSMRFRKATDSENFASTLLAPCMYLQGGAPAIEDYINGDHKLKCDPSEEYGVYTYDLPFLATLGRNATRGVGSYERYTATSYVHFGYAVGTGATGIGANNWTWSGRNPIDSLEFFFLGAYGGSASRPLFAYSDNRANIVEGATVEIDYIIFANSARELNGYTSYIQDVYNESVSVSKSISQSISESISIYEAYNTTAVWNG